MTARNRALLILAALFVAGLVTGVLVATNCITVREAAAGFQQAVIGSALSALPLLIGGSR